MRASFLFIFISKTLLSVRYNLTKKSNFCVLRAQKIIIAICNAVHALATIASFVCVHAYNPGTCFIHSRWNWIRTLLLLLYLFGFVKSECRYFFAAFPTLRMYLVFGRSTVSILKRHAACVELFWLDELTICDKRKHFIRKFNGTVICWILATYCIIKRTFSERFDGCAHFNHTWFRKR